METGTPNIGSIIGLVAGLEYLTIVGRERIEAHELALRAALRRH
ncbi:aminotransferase class V-fold PLP-dependent enzyme [Bradyrhizobium arachidis]|nr:aminotransferase class V-fold PLP-dependent enzyme [Bradyrhizobium arachidis]